MLILLELLAQLTREKPASNLFLAGDNKGAYT